MKKFFAVISLLIVALLSVGCANITPSNPDASLGTPNNPDANGADGEWIAVQSISYWQNSYQYQHPYQSNTITSTCSISVSDKTEVTKEEYDSVGDDQHRSYYDDKEIVFSVERQKFLSDLEQSIGKAFYYYEEDYGINDYGYEIYKGLKYFKYTITGYELYYKYVRFLNGGDVEIGYSNNFNSSEIFVGERIKALSYTVTYFND